MLNRIRMFLNHDRLGLFLAACIVIAVITTFVLAFIIAVVDHGMGKFGAFYMIVLAAFFLGIGRDLLHGVRDSFRIYFPKRPEVLTFV